MKDIVLKDVSKSYDGLTVVEGLNLTLEAGKITCLLGVSGVGKTTILNIIGGLAGSQGSVSGVPERISYIFQNPTLLPNMTVEGNLDFVLRSQIKDKEERKKIIAEAIQNVGLSEFAKAYPYQLSAGMAQRVSMARAFVYPSELILMDEPFRGLDVATKARLLEYFLALWQKSKKTVLLVTHNIDEAVLLSDKILVLGGRPARISAEYFLNSDKFARKLSDKDAAEVFGKIYDWFAAVTPKS